MQVPREAQRYVTADEDGNLPAIVRRHLAAPPVQVPFESAPLWHTTHTFGRIPAVTILDSSGKQIEAVVTVTVTDVTVTFSEPVDGSLLLQ